jgi:pyruvate,phosphate dikinase
MPYVYAFEEGSKEQKYLLGGKGANLAEMTRLGLPVPPGFTITTEACNAYMAADDTIPPGLMDEVAAALGALETKMGKRLGDAADPLLVSVRSGAPFSMPGMMDTVLNLGLNDVSVGGLARQTGNPRFAYDSYRRFVQMFGKIVLDIGGDKFEKALEELREQRGVETDPELSAEDLQGLAERFKAIVLAEAGIEFPQDPKDQLRLAIEAVFRSWNGERARIYRRMEKIPDDLGTAVNVQTMVFGNKGDDSGTGVAPVRRLPEERAGRRRRRRDPHHRAARRDGQRVPRVPPGAARAHADPAEPLPRHVRHRVHHRAGPPLPPADPRRQTHRGRGAADGGGDAGRRAHRPARGRAARGAVTPRPAPAPAVRP